MLATAVIVYMYNVYVKSIHMYAYNILAGFRGTSQLYE